MDSDNFFISKEGKTDLKKELFETIDALKNGKSDILCTSNTNKLFITNDYKKLLKDNKYAGAFFWNNSRPNITFIKNRLENQNINLSTDYEKFVEDL